MAKSAPNSRVRGPEHLEPRNHPAAAVALVGGVLTIVGDAARDNILVSLDAGQLIVRSFAVEVARFDSDSVASIAIDSGAGDDVVRIDRDVLQPATINGNAGNDSLAGGGGPTTINGGPG